jgi:uncharacterized damage-inducible protein DinB
MISIRVIEAAVRGFTTGAQTGIYPWPSAVRRNQEAQRMTYYGGRELAASFRTVRDNTIKIAEEIPESSYSFSPADGCRTVAQTLGHIAAIPHIQTHIQKNRLDDITKVDFGALVGEMAAVENTPRTKQELIELLKSEREVFASWVESLPESFLGETVAMFPGTTPATKSRLEMLLSVKEHEMHHRGQLMLAQRLLGQTPHLTRERQKRAEQAAQAAAQAGR